MLQFTWRNSIILPIVLALLGFILYSPTDDRSLATRKLYTYYVQGNLGSIPRLQNQDDSNPDFTIIEYFLQVQTSGQDTIFLQSSNFCPVYSTPRDDAISKIDRTMLESVTEFKITSEGQPVSMKVQKEMSQWAMNFKKGQASQFILNTGNSNDDVQYVVEERSALGKCQTEYSVVEVTENPIWEVSKRAEVGRQQGILSDRRSDVERNNDCEEEADRNYEEFTPFCKPPSKIFVFKKFVQLHKCANRYFTTTLNVRNICYPVHHLWTNPSRPYDFVSFTSFVLSTAKGNRTKNLVLLNVEPALPNSLLPKVTPPYTKVTDLSYRPIDNVDQAIGPAYTVPDDRHQNNDTSSDRKFRQCLARHGVHDRKLVSRDLLSTTYELLNRQWNLRLEMVYPRAYFLPTNSKDVSYAVKCGLTSRIHLVPNSGGHSYEAVSWGSNDTVVVDFRNMKRISIETHGTRPVGRIEPGALVGHINAFLWENGGYALPMGNCQTVGIGGHAIGGGVGYFAAQFGLTIDNVLEYEVVDGRGTIVVANGQENPDLFWALRGSGPGYIGIVTSFKVELFEAQHINITTVQMFYHVRDFAQTYLAFQNMLRWISDNEPTVFLGFVLTNDDFNATQPRLFPGGIRYIAVHIQHPDIQPHNSTNFLNALDQIFPPTRWTYRLNPNYLQFAYVTGYAPVIFQGSPITSPPNPLQSRTDEEQLAFLKSVRKEDAAPRYFKTKSFFIKKSFTQAELKRVEELVQRIPKDNIWIMCNTEQGMIQSETKNATGYVHRDAIVDLSIHYEGSALPEQVERGMKYLYELWNTVQFMDGGETYQNYPDMDVKDHWARNYGQNLNRLMRLKTKWDPTKFFVTPFSLRNFPLEEHYAVRK